MGILPPATSLAGTPTFTSPPPLIPLNLTLVATNSMARCSIDPPSSNAAQADMPSLTVAKQTLMPTGMFMGDTMLPLPENLRRKILNLEYVEMADLHPEAWMLEEEFTDKTLAALFKRRKEPVTNILVWVQCYASLVALLAQQYPMQTPQFIAYLVTIVRAHRNFEGLGWVVYDTAYRRQAAVWSKKWPTYHVAVPTGNALASQQSIFRENHLKFSTYMRR